MSTRSNDYNSGIEFLRNNSELFERMYDRLGYLEQRQRNADFQAFVSTIVGQQLSGKAADTIYSRLLTLLSNDVSPQSLNSKTIDELRSVGISNAKARYILMLAEKFIENQISIEGLNLSTDEELYEKLNDITGIGPWSARIIMLFNFNRLQAFPFGDATLERAYQSLTKNDLLLLKEDVEKWQPYSGIVAMYLWSFVDDIGLDDTV